MQGRSREGLRCHVDPHFAPTLIGVRKQVAGMSIQLSDQIRGVMKTFGLIVPKRKGQVFERHVHERFAGNDNLANVILPLADAWRHRRKHVANLDRQLLAAARTSKAAQLLMTIPGIGSITSLSFSAAIEDPGNFKRSRSVGAWLGLTTRRYQSGEIDCDGHISRRGDSHVRSLLYEAAIAMLARTKSRNNSDLKDWGLRLRERLGIKRAAVSVVRKLAVIVEDQTHSTFAHFGGKFVRCLAHVAPSYSQVRASGKPGAVQAADIRS